ncbi:hypothetical protein PBI_NESBITT_58 [Streptomyces phage Nesbitt]|uniref:Uncharacterized protein n=2 Tax=Abbeymikolonvirus abbeymikolon TaxID=2734213 RepID=A0A2P1JT41_9CAUD|nr:hypothetical protein HOS57_gp52 [Streptomyces phage AbbeyMikolon]AUG87130.1 hypothetical protein SEA_ABBEYMIKOLON_64 [Streptomyces phage AbbeyMikolon]AVO22315.1 hypothetical protein PBI_NESBITT_58 [Streptomyces phage Nesbitt]
MVPLHPPTPWHGPYLGAHEVGGLYAYTSTQAMLAAWLLSAHTKWWSMR